MLRAEREGAVAVWTIDRPASKNALDAAVMAALDSALDAAAADMSLRAVVLTGAGDSFSSGGNLQELRAVTGRAETRAFCDKGRDICRKIGELRVPVIAAVPGVAFGGGAELAVACDLRIADPRARFSFKQARMGVTTAWGTISRLVALVGHGAASRLLLTAHEVDANEALELGLTDAVSDTGSAVVLALAWAHDIGAGAPKAVGDLKTLLRIARERPADVGAEETERFVDTWTGPEHTAAIEAYFSRRPPRWPGS